MSGSARAWTVVATLSAGVAVALGAFGAHGLEGRVTEARLDTFQTGVRYQVLHALGILALAARPPLLRTAAPLLFAGSAVFSGALYLLVVTGASWLGAVAPVGGALMIVGWATAAYRAARA